MTTSLATLPAEKRFIDEDKSLACIHCGLCLGSCPTFLETGNENDSPRGRIYLMRAIQAGTLALNDTSVRHIDLCLGCRACESACPSGVHYGELLETTREHIEKHHRRSPFQTFLRRVAIEKVFPFPWRVKLTLAPAGFIRMLGLTAILPRFAREALELVPDRLDATPLPALSPALSETKRGKVGFISGCVMSVMFGDTNAASVRLLNRLGYDVLTPGDQGCCGALYAHSGNMEKAREFARHNIKVFEKLNVDLIIINAAGCGSTLKEYGHMLHDDPQWAKRAEAFTAKVRDLVEVLAKEIAPATRQGTSLVTYHDACHLAHPQHITKPPRDLIRAVAGECFVELPESDVCCGSAGSYNLTEPEMAARLQKRKIDNIIKTGAKTVVTTNPGCLLQIRAGLRKADHNIEILHIADYLDRAGPPAKRE